LDGSAIPNPTNYHERLLPARAFLMTTHCSENTPFKLCMRHPIAQYENYGCYCMCQKYVTQLFSKICS